MMKIQGHQGYLEWYSNFDLSHDAIVYGSNEESPNIIKIPKSRPDDFTGEIEHVEDLLMGNIQESPISLNNGIETMNIIAASHVSHTTNTCVHLEPDSWKTFRNKLK